MGLEQKVNGFLNRYPSVKKIIKRVYQVVMYTFSKKIKKEGDIERVSPNDKYEYFFGYYDKSPWDITDRYMLCMRANNTWKYVAPKEEADILLIDTWKKINDKERVKKIGKTSSWNVQQSCMLQWLGPNYNSRIIYNDFRNDKFCSIILDLSTMKEKVIECPVYSVSSNGKYALSLDFSRLHTLRPGYGYSNIEDKTKEKKVPEGYCIWKVDLETGEIKGVMSYENLMKFEPRPEMDGAIHKVNHIMISPKNDKFMFLHRWFKGTRKFSRLITCNIDGTNMYNLSDADMVSHCNWKNNIEILAFENKKQTGNGYYLMKDNTQEYEKYWKELCEDGHPSYSPNGKYVVTDTYPNRKRIQFIKIMDAMKKNGSVTTVAKVFSPFKYDNDTRCDLHPRWNHKSNQICFDGTFEGKRRLYIVKGIDSNGKN